MSDKLIENQILLSYINKHKISDDNLIDMNPEISKNDGIIKDYETKIRHQTNQIDLLLYNCSKTHDYSQAFNSPCLKNNKIYDGNNKRHLYRLMLSGNKLNNLATKCVKKDLFLSIGFERIKNFFNAEDLYMVVMIINAAKRPMYIEDVLYYYRTNEASTTHKYNPYYFDSLKKTNTLCIY